MTLRYTSLHHFVTDVQVIVPVLNQWGRHLVKDIFKRNQSIQEWMTSEQFKLNPDQRDSILMLDRSTSTYIVLSLSRDTEKDILDTWMQFDDDQRTFKFEGKINGAFHYSTPRALSLSQILDVAQRMDREVINYKPPAFSDIVQRLQDVRRMTDRMPPEHEKRFEAFLRHLDACLKEAGKLSVA